MKKNSNILLYMHKREAKAGIKERQVPAGFFLFAKIVYIMSLIVSSATALLAVLGRYINTVYIINNVVDGQLNSEQNALFNSAKLTLALIPVCVVLMIIGAVLLFKKRPLLTLLSSLFGGGGMLLIMTEISKEAFSEIGLPTAYIWRHAVPLGVYIIITLVYCIWAITLNAKEDKAYKAFTARLYEMHGGKDLSEDEWEEFLENYDPSMLK